MLPLLAELAVDFWLYRPRVLLIAGVTGIVLAAVVLNLHRLVLRQDNWTRYFGWTFGVFGLQSLILAACSWAGKQDSFSTWRSVLLLTEGITSVLGSKASTLLLLAVALGLLGKAKAGKPIPVWAWTSAGFVTGMEFLGPDAWYWRVSDAAFSSFCLVVLGQGLFINLKQKHPKAAWAVLLGNWFYALLHVVYIFNPVIAEISFRPGLTVYDRLAALDTLIFVLAAIFKLGLFLSGLLLMIDTMLIFSPGAARGLFESIASGRHYSEPEEIARTIGESVGADFAALWIRWPGSQESVDHAVRGKYWYRSEGMSINPGKLASEVIFERGVERILSFSESGSGTAAAVVPVRFHGAVIGCLHLGWRRRPGYNVTTLQRIRQMADWLSPLVHQVRQLMAINRISVDFHAIAERGSEFEDMGQALNELVPAMHRTLLPLASGCLIDIGFKSAWMVCSDEGTESGDGDLAEDLEKRVFAATGLDRMEDCDFSITDLRVHGAKVGGVVFAIHQGRDPLTRPSLTTSGIQNERMASLLAETFLDIAQAELGAVLGRLQVELNLALGDTAQSWFNVTQTAARRAGIRWVVVSLSQGSERLLGGEGIELVRSLESSGVGEGWENDPIISLPVEESSQGVLQVVVLRLLNSGARLWLGIGRHMDRELDFPSPWRRFLEGLAQATDSALVWSERHRLQLEAKQFENVAIRVETSALLMHTLGNEAAALLHGAERLEEMLPPAGAPATDQLLRKVEGIKKSAQSLQEQVGAFRQAVPFSLREQVRLRDATEKIRALYEDSFRKNGITLEVDMAPDLFIGVPLDVAYLVLVMLTVNASEAIDKRGTIKISAYNGGGKVCCKVEDSGPGISEEVAGRIFDLGFSTKTNGTGLGLPLARNSLLRHKGDLVLTSWRPGATSFTVYFPT